MHARPDVVGALLMRMFPNLELCVEPSAALPWYDLVQVVNPGLECVHSDVSVPTRDELIQGIMDEHVLLLLIRYQ